MPPLPVKDLEHQILTKIDNIRTMLSEIKLTKRAVVPDTFIDLLDDLLFEVRGHFLSEIDDIVEAGFENQDEEITKLAMTYMALFRSLHSELFTFLYTSEYSTLSNETLFVLRNLVKKFASGFELALIPTWEYGYCVHIYKDLYIRLAEAFGLTPRSEKNYPSWFVFLKYPSIEANNILLNCVFSHEIAHFKDYLDATSERLIKDIKIDEDEFESYLRYLLEQKVSGKSRSEVTEQEKRQLTFGEIWGKEAIRQDIYARISKIIENWLKEMVADLLALRTFGPAFLYSLIESSILLQVMDTYADSHPSSTWRIKYCLDELRHPGFMEKATNEAVGNYLEDWYRYLEGAHKEPTYPPHRVSFVSIKKALPSILEFIRIVSKPFTFDVKAYNRVSEIIKSRFLLKGIPPIAAWDKESHQYFNNIYTLNATWEVFLTDKDAFYQNFQIDGINDKLKANEILNKLALKALESSDILRLWRDSQ
jgi:hypothetical protein